MIRCTCRVSSHQDRGKPGLSLRRGRRTVAETASSHMVGRARQRLTVELQHKSKHHVQRRKGDAQASSLGSKLGRGSRERRAGSAPPRMSGPRQTTRASRDSTQAEHGLPAKRSRDVWTADGGGRHGARSNGTAAATRARRGAESRLDEECQVRTVAETARRSLMSGYSLPRRMSSGDTKSASARAAASIISS